MLCFQRTYNFFTAETIKMMKFVIGILLLSVFGLPLSETIKDTAIAHDSLNEYNRKQTLLLSALSIAPQILWNAELVIPSVRDFKEEHGTYPWFVPATLALEPAPLYWIDYKEALLINGIQAICLSTSLIGNTTNPYTDFAMTENYLFTAMLSSYRIYTTMRRNSQNPYYRQNVKYFSTADLMVAPYKPKNLFHPVNLITIGLTSAGMAIAYAISDGSNSVWNSSKAYYANGKEIDASLGAGLVAIECLSHNFTKGFEEAFWRGMVYEELKFNFEKTFWPRFISAGLFGLWHTAPMYTEYGYTKEAIPFAVIAVTLGGYIIAIIHDTFGLEVASACHAWLNTTMALSNYLFFTGSFKKQEPTNDNSSYSKTMPMGLGFTFQF